jgi:KDO2-lipid IV(A) lauroyltransferase
MTHDHAGRPARAATAAVSALVNLVAAVPAPASLWLGRRLGDVAAMVLRRRHRLALANLAVAFPALGQREHGHLARRAWQHLGMTFVELCRLYGRPLEDTIERISVEGLDHLRETMARHGRVLVLTAHLGNWELLCAAHRLTGFPLSVVVRPLDSRWLAPLVTAMRRKAGVELMHKRGALRPVLEALRRGRMVAVLLDQNASRREAVFVPFFGRPAGSSRSLALLALRTRTPVVPVFISRQAGGRHRVTFQAPLEIPGGLDPEAAVLDLTARCTQVIEAAIRGTPEQWLWIHDRWRTRPPAAVVE